MRQNYDIRSSVSTALVNSHESTYLYDVHEKGKDGHGENDLTPCLHPVQDPSCQWQQNRVERDSEEDENEKFHEQERGEVDSQLL
jgi:hypothetical protein